MSDKARKGRNFGAKDGRVMNEELLDVAKELTYQTELEGWAGTFAKTIDQIPVLRPFFPFVKTGHNIMVYTGTHTPHPQPGSQVSPVGLCVVIWVLMPRLSTVDVLLWVDSS